MTHTTRRSFLKSTAGGVFLGLPASTYRSALLAQEKPSETVRVGCIGVGGQGKANMNAIKKNVVAVCDVDKGHLAAAAARSGEGEHQAADLRRLPQDARVEGHRRGA